MAWRSSGKTNEELVLNLWKNGQIEDEKVRDVMLKVDRAHYCASPSTAYEDSPQSIGHQATISAPHMHAAATSSLLPFLHPGARVLDVGSGSGYLTAVLAELVCPSTISSSTSPSASDFAQTASASSPPISSDREAGKVVAIEHIPALRDLGEQNMRKAPRGRELIASGRVSFVQGDGRKGWKEGEGWDAIHVGAAAKELHGELVEQLRCPGRMFIPVEDHLTGYQHIWVVDKDKEGVVSRKMIMGVNYVPLTDAPTK